MKKTSVCLLIILCLFILPVESKAHPSARDIPKPSIAIEVDPLKNKLTVYKNGAKYKIYPIALGKPDTPTPVGDLKVINKYKNWGSGFGTRWIGLNVPWGTYGIHGTNRPYSIGHDASHGCIRMLNRHVEELYELVEVGTPVFILGHVLGEPHMEIRRLARGDSGADVQLLQNRLRSAGYYKGRCRGNFDLGTELALKAFEKAHKLPVDGIMSKHDYLELGILE